MASIDVSHSCTNIAIWYIVNDVIPVLDTGIQLLCNLIKNVCFSVRQLPLAHQLSYKQNFWIPVSSTGMTSSKMNIRTVMCLALKWHHFLSVENVNRKIAWHFVPRLVL
ncbi:hypothetical protein ACJUAD_02185 [Wolbachia endosymbiont of Rhagoletis indifferens]|uniref:hypothetical protein n=1 Tax=Wolbachia TaxID=953 RepID=UPI001ABE06E5|nr:hypothetical protein [Wolbachia pipientis]QTG99306.1 hypothetical protein J5252_02605 [Wolbachia pipientis]